jgi:hypothetical protein
MPCNETHGLAAIDAVYHVVKDGPSWGFGAFGLFKDARDFNVRIGFDKTLDLARLTFQRQNLPVLGLLRFTAVDEIFHGKVV